MVAAVTALRPLARSRVPLPALALAFAAASVAIAFRGSPSTTYAAASTAAAAFDLIAGLGLIGIGVLAYLQRARGSTGPVAILLGAAWLAPDWVGWTGGHTLVRSLAMIVAPFLVPLLVHLVLAFPAGRVIGSVERAALIGVYGAAAVVGVGRALVRDPVLDPYCWSNCTDNIFLVHAAPTLARALDGFWLRFSTATALLLAGFALWRLLTTSPAGRNAFAPVLLAIVLVAASEAAHAALLLRNPAEDPQASVFQALFVARALAVASLAGGIAWTVGRERRMHAAIARLATDLGEAPAPGSLQAALARSLGDPALEVVYPLGAGRGYVDAAGRLVEPRADGRAATQIVRAGRPLALVVHDAGLSAGPELAAEIGAAARLAVDNERLRAELLAQLEELRASRVRIVETGDATRRRLERDLHDGAQQRLLALSYELRIARAAAESEGDSDGASLLARAIDETRDALEELRDLAHGIYPAILAEAGLGPALATLADTAALAVAVTDVTSARYLDAVETTAYVVVAEGVADAERRGASHAEVRVREAQGQLVVTVEDGGTPRSSALVHLSDRVGALGGRLQVGQTTLRAEIPCA